MTFVMVIDSPNNKAEIKSTKIKLVPLNIKAVDRGNWTNSRCQNMAYKPITVTAPIIHSIYGQDKNTCPDAIFVKIEVQAYIRFTPKSPKNNRFPFPITD